MTAVLSFHDLGPRSGASISTCTAQQFTAVLDRLTERGFRFVPLARLLDGPGNEREIVLSLDDAFQSQLETALPILRERSIPATLFVVAGRVGKQASWDYTGRARLHASWDALREWLAAGLTIGSHGLTHRNLRRVSPADLRRELRDSRLQLEETLACEVYSVAYPFGRHDARVTAVAEAAGYKLGLTSRPGLVNADLMVCPRIMVSRLDTPMAVEQRLSRTLWGRVERGKQRIISFWAGGTVLYQGLRGDYR